MLVLGPASGAVPRIIPGFTSGFSWSVAETALTTFLVYNALSNFQQLVLWGKA